MKKPSKKKLIWTAGALLVLLMIFNAMRSKRVEVDLGEVTRGPLMVTVDEDGEARVREPYLISAPLAGRLLRVELEPGDEIEKGQSLLAIDPGEPGLLDARTEAEAEARVNAAEARHRVAVTKFEIAEAEAAKAARYLIRDEGRFEKGNIAQPTLEDTKHADRIAKSNLDAAKSAVEISKFELEQAQAAVLYSRSVQDHDDKSSHTHFEIKSPIEGVVLRRFQESSTVIPGGARILEIGDPADLEIRIDTLSQDAVKIASGQRIIIEHWGGDIPLQAHVRRVEPSAFTKVSALGVDEQRVWIFADLATKKPEKKQGQVPDQTEFGDLIHQQQLGDGYRIEARIVVWEKEDVLRVPAGALFRQKDQWCVYVHREGKAKLTILKLGQNNGIEAEVISGIVAGDRVVLHPSDQVTDGAAIKNREG